VGVLKFISKELRVSEVWMGQWFDFDLKIKLMEFPKNHSSFITKHEIRLEKQAITMNFIAYWDNYFSVLAIATPKRHCYRPSS